MGRRPRRVVAITGGARGIGLGIGQHFAQAGWSVALGDYDQVALEEAASHAWQTEIFAHHLDVRQPASSQEFVRAVVEDAGRLDVLVNSAGLVAIGPSLEVTAEDWTRQLDVLLSGTFFCSQAAARAMISQGGGAIVNIASIGGMGGWPMRAAYNSAKAGVIVLTEVLATEWASYGIRVNSVSPGVTRTEMMQVAISQGIASVDAYASRTPLKRVAEVPEVASAVFYLASDRAGAVTGINLRVDGGWVAWANPEAVPSRL